MSSPYASAAAVGSLMMRSTSRPAISPASLVAWRSASSKYAGTVTTAWVTVSPRYASASRLSFCRMRAEISCGVYALPSMSIVQLVPMWRFTERIVRSGLVIAWRLATSPTSTSPVFENATTDGVVRDALGVGDDDRLARLEGRDDRVGGAEVDADGLGHVCASGNGDLESGR